MTIEETDETELAPSKSQIKRECHHLLELGETLLKLKPDDLESLDLSSDLERAIDTAHKIKSRSGLKRQRQYIGKLLRVMDTEMLEAQVNKIIHRHDTNTAQFKRLEKWRDALVKNNKQVLDDVISHFPNINRQHINQLIRLAQQEEKRNKPPASARKIFKYLHQLEQEKQ